MTLFSFPESRNLEKLLLHPSGFNQRKVKSTLAYCLQTGIIAWGVECGINEVPGVYANVTEGLCFIDAATKCVLGQDADYYGLQGCRKWAKRQFCQLKDELETLQVLIEQTTELREKGKLFRKSRKIEALVPKFEAMIGECDEGEDNYDCSVYDYFPDSDYIDISIHAKMKDNAQKEEEEGDIDPRKEELDETY